MYGTLVNTAAVIVGSIIGLVFHARLPKKITAIVFQAIGLFTLFIGFSMALKTENLLILVFSVVIGSIIGESLDLDSAVNRLGEWLKHRVKSTSGRFSVGLVTAFLMFCMGSMAILGSIEEGLGGEPNLLYAKSVLDGFSSIALSASLGVGVMFSAIPLLIYQGGLTLFAGSAETIFNEIVMNELTAVGGLLLIGLGISILEIKKIKVLNMVPSLLVAVVLALLV